MFELDSMGLGSKIFTYAIFVFTKIFMFVVSILAFVALVLWNFFVMGTLSFIEEMLKDFRKHLGPMFKEAWTFNINELLDIASKHVQEKRQRELDRFSSDFHDVEDVEVVEEEHEGEVPESIN